MLPRTKCITQRELAAMLGVDRSTISLALQNSPRISEETRENVRELCRRFNYRPNPAACRLKSSSVQQQVSLVLPATFASITEGVVAQTICALASQLNQRHTQLNIVSCPMTRDEAPDPWEQTAVGDFALIWGDIPIRAFEAIVPPEVPQLILDPSLPEEIPHARITIRNEDAGRAMVEHLIQTGVTRLLFVNARPGRVQHEARWHGARSAWLATRSTATLQYCTLDELSDVTLKELCTVSGSAIFCSNDQGAFEIHARLASLGFQAPAAVKLAGFDNLPASSALGLTTMHFDCEAVAAAAVSAIAAHAEGTPLNSRSLPALLIARRTTGCF